MQMLGNFSGRIANFAYKRHSLRFERLSKTHNGLSLKSHEMQKFATKNG